MDEGTAGAMSAAQWGWVADRMATAWPQERFGEGERELYFEVLGGLPAAAVTDAVIGAIRESGEAMPAGMRRRRLRGMRLGR